MSNLSPFQEELPHTLGDPTRAELLAAWGWTPEREEKARLRTKLKRSGGMLRDLRAAGVNVRTDVKVNPHKAGTWIDRAPSGEGAA